MKKLRTNKGFTLIEMLACVITLLLIGMICSTGLNFALRSYNESVFESDSQMLSESVDMYIGDILRHSSSIEIDELTVKENYGYKVEQFNNIAYRVFNGNIEVSPMSDEKTGGYLILTGDASLGNAYLVGIDTYAKTLYIDSFELYYDDTTGIFKGNYTIKSTILNDASRNCSFSCRTIADN